MRQYFWTFGYFISRMSFVPWKQIRSDIHVWVNNLEKNRFLNIKSIKHQICNRFKLRLQNANNNNCPNRYKLTNYKNCPINNWPTTNYLTFKCPTTKCPSTKYPTLKCRTSICWSLRCRGQTLSVQSICRTTFGGATSGSNLVQENSRLKKKFNYIFDFSQKFWELFSSVFWNEIVRYNLTLPHPKFVD